MPGRAAYRLRLPDGDRLCCLGCALRHRPLLARSLRIAVLVGTVLVAINHAGRLLHGPLTAGLAIQILLTYLVPFCVATWGALGSARVPADDGA